MTSWWLPWRDLLPLRGGAQTHIAEREAAPASQLAPAVSTTLPLEIVDRIAQMLVEDGQILRTDNQNTHLRTAPACAAVNKRFRAHVCKRLWRVCDLSPVAYPPAIPWIRSVLPGVVRLYVHDIHVHDMDTDVSDACEALSWMRDVDFDGSNARLWLSVGDNAEDDAGPDRPEAVFAVLSSLRSLPRSIKIDLAGASIWHTLLSRYLTGWEHITVLSLWYIELGDEGEGPSAWMDALASLPSLAALEIFACYPGDELDDKVPRFPHLRFANIVPNSGPAAAMIIRAVLERAADTLEGLAIGGQADTGCWPPLAGAQKLEHLFIISDTWHDAELWPALSHFQGHSLAIDGIVGRTGLRHAAALLRSSNTAWPFVRSIYIDQRHWPAGDLDARTFGQRGVELVHRRPPIMQMMSDFTFSPRHFDGHHAADDPDFWQADIDRLNI